MIVVHHLNDSRSQRILWLLEELGLPYELKRYQRNAQRFAPPELMMVHPLGKSPVITDGNRTIAESGAIIDYLIRHYGSGRLQPAPDTRAYEEYLQWMHFAEGSAMVPLALNAQTLILGQMTAPLKQRIESELAIHLSYIDRALNGRQFLVGDSFTGADIMLSFVAEYAGRVVERAAYTNLDAWIKRMHERPAYKKALERGGPYILAN
jgi:glutathione S-transferase